MSSAIIEVPDTLVVNVSLPHIAGSLSAKVDESTWDLTSYLIANAVILPISGWRANLIGRKRQLLTVVSGFTISSLLCGMAPSLPALIFFRVLQGTTGGGLQPLWQVILLEEFPVEERGKAMAFWSIGILAAPVLGPNWFASHFIVTLAVVGLTAFVIRELITPQPIVRFRLSRYRSFAAGIVLGTLLAFVLYDSLVILPHGFGSVTASHRSLGVFYNMIQQQLYRSFPDHGFPVFGVLAIGVAYAQDEARTCGDTGRVNCEGSLCSRLSQGLAVGCHSEVVVRASSVLIALEFSPVGTPSWFPNNVRDFSQYDAGAIPLQRLLGRQRPRRKTAVLSGINRLGATKLTPTRSARRGGCNTGCRSRNSSRRSRLPGGL